VVHNDFQVVKHVRMCHILFHVSASLEALRVVNHNVKGKHGFDIYLDYGHGC
jgi:hypothetical protein